MFSGFEHLKYSDSRTFQGRIQDFFLGGGALVSCSTSTPINHTVSFFWQNTSCIRKPLVTSGGVRTPCTLPLDPPLRLYTSESPRTFVWMDEKYSLQIPDSNSPKRIWFKNVSDSWRNLLFVNLAFKAQPVSMLLPSPSVFWLFLRLMYSKRKPVYKLCKEPWTLRWKCLFVFSLQAPINDNKACVSLMGIKSTTKKAHIVRAILESIAYR